MNNRLIIVSLVIALCTGTFPTAPAQTAVTEPSGRFLLVFDTSSAMKTRVSSEQYAVERLFFSMMNGQLRAGDTIGVWAFDRKLHAGEFPLEHWQSQNAAAIASHVTNFVGHQRYSRSAQFEVVMPNIINLAQNSERLTVLIFCDGEDEIQGTPYDQFINNTFKENQRALKNAKQAFIIVLRSQFGQFIGYTVNSSGVGVDFPSFPPLPQPPQPVATATNNLSSASPQPPAPVTKLPPLVIVGTNVSTKLIPLVPPTLVITNRPSVETESNPPPLKVKSNPPSALETPTGPTNAVLAKMSIANTNAATSIQPPENPSGLSRNGAMAIGAVLLVLAIILIISISVRSGKSNRGSLISGAMKKK